MGQRYAPRPSMQLRRLTQEPGRARRAAMPFYTVAALIALAPTFQAASRVAERESERAARPDAVFPVLGQLDWGDADARFGATRSGNMHEGQAMFTPPGEPAVALRD